jgi:hypothetical protein
MPESHNTLLDISIALTHNPVTVWTCSDPPKSQVYKAASQQVGATWVVLEVLGDGRMEVTGNMCLGL